MVAKGPGTGAGLPSAELSASGRNPDGTFARSNVAALKHGGRSAQVRAAQLPEQAGLQPVLARKREAIISDLGGDTTLSQLQQDLVERYLELDTVASWLGGNLMADGPLTAKGRSRAALSTYLTVVDRLHRVSAALGLTRRKKQVSLDQYLTNTYAKSEPKTS